MKPKPSQQWNDEEVKTLVMLYRRAVSTQEIARTMRRPYKSIESKLFRLRQELPTRRVISSPPMREWNDPIEAEGDALIIPDMETPYHHAEFVNKAIDLALAWGITQVILSGDFVHFANFSQWAADFKQEPATYKNNALVMELIGMMPPERREEAIQAAARRGALSDDAPGISEEMAGVRQTVRELESAFQTIHYIMGNHEQRKLRFQNYAEGPGELLTFFEAKKDKWNVSPYYWCRLRTDDPYTYRIEHPKSASRIAAMDLAVQTQEHIVMGHSHRWAMNRDPSGRLWAIQAGHCVDEMRLQYVQQRSAKRDAHALGAVIVRGGYPHLLSENTPFETFKKM